MGQGWPIRGQDGVRDNCLRVSLHILLSLLRSWGQNKNKWEMRDELARTKRKASLCSTLSPKNYFSIPILIFFFLRYIWTLFLFFGTNQKLKIIYKSLNQLVSAPINSGKSNVKSIYWFHHLNSFSFCYIYFALTHFSRFVPKWTVVPEKLFFRGFVVNFYILIRSCVVLQSHSYLSQILTSKPNTVTKTFNFNFLRI